MKPRSLIILIVITSLLVFSSFPALRITKARRFSSVWFEPFSGPNVYDSFDGPLKASWITYRGNPTIVAAGGRQSVLKLTHPETGDPLGHFGSSASTSLFLTNPATADFADGMIEFDLYFETSGWAGVSAMLTFRMQSENIFYALRLTSTRDWYCSFVLYLEGQERREIGAPSERGVFPTGAWSHVVVTIGGPRMSCYMDGILICSAYDETWSQGRWGGIGLQNNYYGGVFYVDNFRMPRSTRMRYQEEIPGDTKMKWTIYRGSPRIDKSFGRSGSSLLLDHPSIFGDEAPFGSLDSCSVYVSDPDTHLFQNGVIEFDMYFDNDVGQKAFVTFRMENGSSYYAALLTSTYDWSGCFIRRFGANNWYTFGTKSYRGAIVPKRWFHVTIIIDGGHFELWRDWELLYSGDDWSIPQGKWGGIGFYSAYYGSAFYIDNVKICVQA